MDGIVLCSLALKKESLYPLYMLLSFSAFHRQIMIKIMMSPIIINLSSHVQVTLILNIKKELLVFIHQLCSEYLLFSGYWIQTSIKDYFLFNFMISNHTWALGSLAIVNPLLLSSKRSF